MTDRPIIFSALMVRALLAGRKTQTRRVLKPQPVYLPRGQITSAGWAWKGLEAWPNADTFAAAAAQFSPYAPGDRLWLKEAWRTVAQDDGFKPSELRADRLHIGYEADCGRGHISMTGRYRHARFMPRWASRLTLLVTDVLVQRLQEISEADARAEGFPITWDGRPYEPPSPDVDSWQGYGRASMCLYWNIIHGPGAWDKNPWVVALTFDVQRRNIDA